ncbi:DUF58 domain-containing protein [Candidatus Woesearchaeota archaeon]|nr:DUF58 domain-containing protein [Candidatus Woesearchaeota archaeon]
MTERSLNINLKPLLKKLEIVTKQTTRGAGGIQGEFRSYFKGIGLEFADYRVYTPADDASKIDWKASLRAGETLIKEYMEGRNLNVFFVIDVSDSMITGTAEKLKCEYAAEVAANIAFASLESQNNVGYIMFSDTVKAFKMPKRGNQQLFLLSKDISNPYLYGGRNNFDDPIKFIMRALPQGSMLILISDFLSLSKSWEEAMQLLSQKFDLICIMIRDRIDYELPGKGEIIVSDINTGQQMLIDTSQVRSRYHTDSESYLAHVKSVISKSKGDLLVLETHEPFNQKIRRFFIERQARWR